VFAAITLVPAAGKHQQRFSVRAQLRVHGLRRIGVAVAAQTRGKRLKRRAWGGAWGGDLAGGENRTGAKVANWLWWDGTAQLSGRNRKTWQQRQQGQEKMIRQEPLD